MSSSSLSLLPFCYFARTRLRSGRDVAFLLVSSWLPALWVVGPSTANIIDFALGYLAFISLYELGYLANDRWDARRSAGGRKRESGKFSLTIFIALRVGTWLAIAGVTGWWRNGDWLLGYTALVTAITLHNLVRDTVLRLASFLVLATLRFSLPVIAIASATHRPVLIASAMLLYAYPRLLAYADSKARLTIPERRQSSFPAQNLVMLCPLVLWLGFPAMTEIYLAQILLALAWWAFRQRAERADKAANIRRGRRS